MGLALGDEREGCWTRLHEGEGICTSEDRSFQVSRLQGQGLRGVGALAPTLHSPLNGL